ncbi:MAG TPA: site-2 protease family protein [Chthoniobacterales bacterium]|jgi:regulator of sigma E protease
MIIQVARVVFTLLEVLVLFNLLIVVHEIGHFLAARWRGLYVEKFGIWFGKPIWKKTINGVQYSLGTLPFGGFVALPQLAPMDIIEGKADVDRAQLPRISALDKIIVAFAGPLFSFLLAIVFAVIIWAVGRPVTESEATTIVGYVVPESPAAEVGLKPGDRILAVDSRPVARFGGMGDDSISWRIVRSEGETIPITFERVSDGRSEIRTVEARPIIPETKRWSRKAFRQIEILPAETPVVGKVEPGSPAANARLRPGDVITGINGERLYHMLGIADYIRAHPDVPLTLSIERRGEKMTVPFDAGHPTIDAVVEKSPAAAVGLEKGDVVVAVDGQNAKSALAVSDYIRHHGERPLRLSILRDAERREVTVTPEVPQDEKVPRIGIQWSEDFGIVLDDYGRMTVKHPAPMEQIRASMSSIVNTLGAVASPKSDVRLQHMSGPVMMLQVYYRMLSSEAGWRMALWFSVVLNVNLALLNLLPIPVLDGGHILLALVEAVRRRPVNMRVLEIVQTACAFVIIGFMIYIAFFDVQDLFGTRRGPKFAPKAAPAKSQQ